MCNAPERCKEKSEGMCAESENEEVKEKKKDALHRGAPRRKRRDVATKVKRWVHSDKRGSP